MLKNILAENITEKITQKGMKYCDFAKQSKTSLQNLDRILKNKTSNPGINTIAPMADVLGCTIDELMGRPTKESSQQNIEIDNNDLFLNIITFVSKKIKKHPYKIYSLDFLKTIMHIYSYSQKQNKIDETFAVWCIEHLLLKKN